MNSGKKIEVTKGDSTSRWDSDKNTMDKHKYGRVRKKERKKRSIIQHKQRIINTIQRIITITN
jgi:hypothetical protein